VTGRRLAAPTLPIVALNVPMDRPAVITKLPGTVIRPGFDEPRVIVVSVGAGCERVAVHKLMAPESSPPGTQTSEVSVSVAFRGMVADFEEPLYAAVTDPLWFTEKGPACRVNVFELEPFDMASESGALSTGLTVVSVTVTVPAAALVNVTVQVLEEFGPRLEGLHKSEETITAADRLTVVLAELLL